MKKKAFFYDENLAIDSIKSISCFLDDINDERDLYIFFFNDTIDFYRDVLLFGLTLLSKNDLHLNGSSLYNEVMTVVFDSCPLVEKLEEEIKKLERRVLHVSEEASNLNEKLMINTKTILDLVCPLEN